MTHFVRKLSLQPQIDIVETESSTAPLHGDFSEDVPAAKFSSHSLRAGLPSSAEVDERKSSLAMRVRK